MQCGAALQISVGCPLFNLTLTPSTWVTFHSLRVQPYKGSGAVASPGCYCTSHRLATRWRFQRPISNSECLYFWPTGYKSEVPTSLHLGSNLLRNIWQNGANIFVTLLQGINSKKIITLMQNEKLQKQSGPPPKYLGTDQSDTIWYIHKVILSSH